MASRKTTTNRSMMQAIAVGVESTELRIKMLGNHPVQSNARKVLLTHLSSEYVRFRTPLWLPPQESWTVSLKFALENVPLEIVGLITHAIDEGGWWTYEVDLSGQPVMRAILDRLIKKRLKSRAPLLYKYKNL